MDFKNGILALTVVIAIVGIMASSGSAYTYIKSHAEKDSGWSCTIEGYSSNNYYIGAVCDSGSEGSGCAKARSGNGGWTEDSNEGMCCIPPKHFKAKSFASGMQYRYAWVGCE